MPYAYCTILLPGQPIPNRSRPPVGGHEGSEPAILAGVLASLNRLRRTRLDGFAHAGDLCQHVTHFAV